MVENIINEALNAYILEIKKTLEVNNINSSGKLSKSLIVKDFKIYSEPYLDEALNGIAPNKYSIKELIPRIKEWTQQKGLPSSLTGAISTVIATRGSRRYRNKDNVALPLFDTLKLEQKIKDDIYNR